MRCKLEVLASELLCLGLEGVPSHPTRAALRRTRKRARLTDEPIAVRLFNGCALAHKGESLLAGAEAGGAAGDDRVDAVHKSIHRRDPSIHRAHAVGKLRHRAPRKAEHRRACYGGFVKHKIKKSQDFEFITFFKIARPSALFAMEPSGWTLVADDGRGADEALRGRLRRAGKSVGDGASASSTHLVVVTAETEALRKLCRVCAPAARVVELGCSYGGCSEVLCGASEEFVGIDTSHQCIAHCKEILPNARFERCDAFGTDGAILKILNQVGKSPPPDPAPYPSPCLKTLTPPEHTKLPPYTPLKTDTPLFLPPFILIKLPP